MKFSFCNFHNIKKKVQNQKLWLATNKIYDNIFTGSSLLTIVYNPDFYFSEKSLLALYQGSSVGYQVTCSNPQ